MIYLKTYESYNDINYDIIIDDIKDICLELSDDGFNIVIVEPNYKNLNRLQISIILSRNMEKADLFELGDVKDTILRIGDYLNKYKFIISEIDSLAWIKKDGSIRQPSKLDLSFNIEEWDNDQEAMLVNIYYDINE
jgi:hypothetical protein